MKNALFYALAWYFVTVLPAHAASPAGWTSAQWLIAVLHNENVQNALGDRWIESIAFADAKHVTVRSGNCSVRVELSFTSDVEGMPELSNILLLNVEHCE